MKKQQAMKFVWIVLSKGVLAERESGTGMVAENQKVAGSIPSQGVYLGCGFDPRLGCVRGAMVDVSLPH